MPEHVGPHRSAMLLAAAAVTWGVATVISKQAVSEIPPLTLLPVQLSGSVLVLLPVTLLADPGKTAPWSAGTRRLALLGVLNPGASYALGLLGLARITASLSVLLWALEPLLILLLARVVLRDRITRSLALSMSAATGGVVLVVLEAGASGDAVGIALTVAGVAACAVYTVLCRLLLADDSALTIVLAQQVAALLFAVAVVGAALAADVTTLPHDVSWGGWASAISSGVLYYAVAFWFYLSGLRHVSAATAGIFLNLVPVAGILAAYVVLDERLTPRQLLGAGIVVVAATVVALRMRRLAPRPLCA